MRVIWDSHFCNSPDYWSGWLPDRSQNVVDSLPCRCQLFRRVSWKSVGDCMRNATNKPPKIPYSAMVDWRSHLESVSWIESPPKVNQFFRLVSQSTPCSKKQSSLMFDNNFGKCGPIFKILSPCDRKKILYVHIQIFPPHLQYVATLPCESRKSKNVTNILRWTWQIGN